MSIYYTSAHATTIVSLMQTGRLPEKMADYVEPKTIALFEKPFDSLPTKEVRLFHQTFVLELKLTFKAKKLDHLDVAWVERILLYSTAAQNLLQKLFHGQLPKPVELRPEIYSEEERVYLDVPFKDKEMARELGARWDPKLKQWYALESQDGITSLWPVKAPPITHLVGEDRNFSGYVLRSYLNVPYEERLQAKEMGAFWDLSVRKWYVPYGRSEHLLQIWPLTNTRFLINRLFVDLIPATCLFTNVRSSVLPADWDRLRKHVYERTGHQCECCLKSNCRLDAHERWHYDTARMVQKLMRLIALCRDCHEATHMGFAIKAGRGEEALQHLIRVTGMEREQAELHVEEAFALCEERSHYQWELDLTVITDSGVGLIEKPESFEREGLAIRGLKRAREGGEESPQKRARYLPAEPPPSEPFCAIL